MNTRALFKYIQDFNMFNLAFCVLVALVIGVKWAIVFFATFGLLIGYIGFNVFKKQEYYAYYNLGLTKRALLLSTFLCNVIVAAFLFIIYVVFSK